MSNLKKYHCFIFLVFIPSLVFGNESLDKLGDSIQEKVDELTEATKELSEEGKELGGELLKDGKKLGGELLEDGKELGKILVEEGKKVGEDLQEATEKWLKKSKQSQRLKKEIGALTNELLKIECSDKQDCLETEQEKAENSLNEECGKLPLIFEIEKRIESQQCRKSSLQWKVRKAKLIHFFD